MNELRFSVAGVPVPQGSLKAFTNRKTGRAMLTSTSGQNLKDWRQAIAWSAQEAMQGFEYLDGKHDAVNLTVTFVLQRPPSVPKARAWPCVLPDIDKLLRSCLDALTGVVYRDDAQVVNVWVSKQYAEPGQQPGAHICVSRQP